MKIKTRSMKFQLNAALTLIFTFCLATFAFAQKQQKAPYYAVIHTVDDQKFTGKITAINDNSISIADKKEALNEINYTKVSKIKVYKNRSDIGYAAITGALALGTIAVAQSIEDVNVALAVGLGGTVGVVGISMLLHNVIHAPEAKLTARKEKINYNSVSSKLAKFVITDAALKP